jgi:hypothetical protein
MSSEQRPKTWIIVISAVWSCFLFPASIWLAGSAAANYFHPHPYPPNTETDKLWYVASMIAGGLVFVTIVSALASSLTGNRFLRYVSLIAHGFTLLGITFAVAQGYQSMTEAYQRGHSGKEQALGIFVFGIVVPGLVGLMVLVNGCLQMWMGFACRIKKA